MQKVLAIAVIYKEPEWEATRQCLLATSLPIVFIDRAGVGSLAEALNRGFRKFVTEGRKQPDYQYIWFVTNVVFTPPCIEELIEFADATGYAALTPCFKSDHAFTRPLPGGLQKIAKPCPFVEFTAPLVRAAVYWNNPLDERMPYWGHDMDWGYRVRQAGHKVGVYYGQELHHVYIRNSGLKNEYTVKRAQARQTTNARTRAALVAKYGPQWKRILTEFTECRA